MAGLSDQVAMPGRQLGSQQAGAREGRQDRQTDHAVRKNRAGQASQFRLGRLG